MNKFVVLMVFKHQNQLLQAEASNTAETLTDSDKEVIHYTCGYLFTTFGKSITA